MLSLAQTFDESRAIKILVVPIGENSLFDKQFEIISKKRTLSMFDLTRPSEMTMRNPQASPFRGVNWNTGRMLLEFVRYDRAAGNTGELDSFQSNRRFILVIGLINYAELVLSKERLQDDMDYYTRRYPNVLLRRYFVFNMFNHTESSTWRIPQVPGDPDAVVIFPPDVECAEGGVRMIDVHLQEMMSGIAVKLFVALENMASAASDEGRIKASGKFPHGLNVFTIFDETEENAFEGNANNSNARAPVGMGGSSSLNLSNASSKMKRRIPGRLKKIVGDLCLQVCSPIDAIDNFTAAVSELRSQNDSMWLGSAYEGLAVSILQAMRIKLNLEELFSRDLKPLMAGGTTTLECAVYKLVEDRCNEAMQLYSRHSILAFLEAECSMRLAKVFEEAGASCVPESEQKVIEYLLRSVTAASINKQQQVDCLLEAALVCHRLKMRRKYAFFLFLASLHASDAENPFVVQGLVRRALQQYGIQLSSEAHFNGGNLFNDPDRCDLEHSLGDGVAQRPEWSWASMRRLLFAYAAHNNREAGDFVAAARSLTGLLRLVAELDDSWRRVVALHLPPTFNIADFDSINVPQLQNVIPTAIENSIGAEMRRDLRVNVMQSPESVAPKARGASKSRRQSAPATGFKAARLAIQKELRELKYSQLHEHMMRAGGIVQNNLSQLMEKNQSLFDFSQHSMDTSNDPASQAVSVLSNLIGPGFLGEQNKTTSTPLNAAKRSIYVPTLDAFTSSLIVMPQSRPRSTANNFPPTPGSTTSGRTASFQGVPSASSTSSLMNPSDPNAAQGPYSPSPTASQVAPQHQMAAPFVSDDYGNPLRGALAPGINAVTRTYMGGAATADLTRLSSLQKYCLKYLESFCFKVPPSCGVNMSSLPTILFVQPLELAPEYRPHVIYVAGSPGAELEKKTVAPALEGGDSALYYDPFEAKRIRGRAKAQKQASEVVWTEKCCCKVLLCISNPLAVKLRLSNVSVVLGAADSEEESVAECFESIPEDVEIPAVQRGGYKYEMIMNVTPLASGKFRVIGLKFFVQNAMFYARIGEDGYAITKIPEVVQPWKYPRRTAPSNRSVDGKNSKSIVNRINVARECALLKMCSSWLKSQAHDVDVDQLVKDPAPSSQPGDAKQSSELLTRPSQALWRGVSRDMKGSLIVETTQDTSPSVLELCDGERRRETLVLTNISNIPISDIRLMTTCMLMDPNSSKSSVSHLLSDFVGSYVEETTAIKGVSIQTGHMSSKAVAAIIDHKNYLAEKDSGKKESNNQRKRRMSFEDDHSIDQSNQIALQELCSIVSVDPIDFGADPSISMPLPIPPNCSVRVTLEFNYRKEFLRPVFGTGPTTNCLLNISAYYISNPQMQSSLYGGDGSSSPQSAEERIRHYRIADTTSNLVLSRGVSLNNLFVRAPNYCSGSTETIRESIGADSKFIKKDISKVLSSPDPKQDDISPAAQTVDHTADPSVMESQLYLDEIFDGVSVLEQLARCLRRASDRSSFRVDFVDDFVILFLQFRNISSNPAVLYAGDGVSSQDNVFDAVKDLRQSPSLLQKSFFFEDDFLSENATPKFALFLPASSAKNIAIKIKLSFVSPGNMSQNEYDLERIVGLLKRRLESLRWGLLSKEVTDWNFFSGISAPSPATVVCRHGAVTMNSLPRGCIRRAAYNFRRSPFSFNNTGFANLSPRAPPSGKSDSLASRPPHVALSTRQFYQFGMTVSPLSMVDKQHLTCVSDVMHHLCLEPMGGLPHHSINKNDSFHLLSRDVEVAVVVFGGHHSRSLVAGTGVGRDGHFRLGITQVVREAANADDDTSSVTALNRNSVEIQKVAKAEMLCHGALASGRLRQSYTIPVDGAGDVHHSVRLAFVQPGMYTIYSLAREHVSFAYEVGSGNGGSDSPVQTLSSAWKLNSKPTLVIVSV